MRNYTAQLWLGAWLFVLPFLGVPGRWKETLTVLTALALIGHALIVYRLRRRTGAVSNPEQAEVQTPKQAVYPASE